MCLFLWGLLTSFVPFVGYTCCQTAENIAFEGPDLTIWIISVAALPAAVAAARFTAADPPTVPPPPTATPAPPLLLSTAPPPAVPPALPTAPPPAVPPAPPTAPPLSTASAEPDAGPPTAGAPVRPTLLSALVAGWAITAVYLVATVAWYRLVFPIGAHPVGGLAGLGFFAATLGAGVGHGIGRFRQLRAWPSWITLPLGLLLAGAGALLAPITVQQAADYSDWASTGPPVRWADQDARTMSISESGWYALLALDDPPQDPGCVLDGAGGGRVESESLTIKPLLESAYDATEGTSLIADMYVAEPGTYVLSCAAGGEYSAFWLSGGVTVSPVADMLFRAPRPVLWLLGALPGGWLVARSVRRARLA